MATDEDVRGCIDIAESIQATLRRRPERRADVLAALAILLGVECGAESPDVPFDDLLRHFTTFVRTGYDLGRKMRAAQGSS